ncbi:hypothetical protein [Streptomyces sp. NPDC096012]|uniref:hypothetical protein n=1 Tax=Streptomyces sp. NPDC096012 TaxID=3155684 RepID=UPI003369F668
MAATDTTARADDRRLNEWLRTRATAFPAWAEQLPDAWDFSTESLDRLETRIRRRYPGREAAEADRDSSFLTVAAWYAGEVHVRNYGAVWRCAPGAGPRAEPVVTLPEEVLTDRELDDLEEARAQYEDDFPACNPCDAVVGAAEPGRTGHLASFLQAYAPWQSVVDRAVARARATPGQSPGSRPLPGAPAPVDPGPVGAALASWLARQEEVHPYWREATGRPDAFDFTPASLTALEEVLRARIAAQTGTVDLLDDPVFHCAVWYLGETVCRGTGARWLPLRGNVDVTLDRLDLLTVGRVGRRVGPCTELTAALHRCVRGVHQPDDSYQPLTDVLTPYR